MRNQYFAIFQLIDIINTLTAALLSVLKVHKKRYIFPHKVFEFIDFSTDEGDHVTKLGAPSSRLVIGLGRWNFV